MNSRSSRPTVWPFLLAILAAFLTAAAAQAQGTGVEVTALTPPLLDVQPGQILSLSFRVTNRTVTDQEVLETLTLPTDWQPLLPEASFTLAPGGDTVRLAAVRVPTTVAAGAYRLTYAVCGQLDPGVRSSDSVAVTVAAVSKLALWPESKPDTVIAGRPIVARLRVVNQGNAPLTVTLSARSDNRLRLALEPERLSLPAASSEVVTLTAETPARARQPRQELLIVRAEALGPDGKPLLAGYTLVVNLLPRVTVSGEGRGRLPVTLGFRLTGGRDNAALQAALAGGGALDESGNRRLEFLLRGPDTQSSSLFGERDEYWLNYHAPDLSLRLGDQSYGLSPLTSYYRYGLGAGLAFPAATGPAGGLYYVQSRWGEPAPELGLYLSQPLDAQVALRLNLMTRSEHPYASPPSGRETVWSLQAEAHPRDMNLCLEYGFSNAHPATGSLRDQAYRFEACGSAPGRASYSLQTLHAGPDYAGYYRDVDYQIASVAVPLGLGVYAHAGYRDWRRNLDLDPSRGAAPHESLWNLGLRCPLDDGWRVSLAYQDFHRRDRLTPASFDYVERPLVLGIDRFDRYSSLRLETRHGRREDRLTGASRLATDVYFYGHFRPSHLWTVSLYGATGEDGDFSTSYLLGTRGNLGASVLYQSPEGTSAGLSYLSYGFAQERNADQWEFFAGKRQLEGQCLEFRLRQTHQALTGTETDYLLAYSFPLDLPLGRGDTGELRGRVYDEAAPGRPGLADVVLRVGDATAVTNEEGEFVFPSLPPGSYLLEVVDTSISISRIPRDQFPRKVEVRTGETTRLDVPLTTRASVRGEINIMSPARDLPSGLALEGISAPGPALVGSGAALSHAGEVRPLVGALVELACGEEVLRVLSDERGRFHFEGLRPGTWHLRVYSDRLPAHHRLEQSERDLTLLPGTSEHVAVRVLPVVRPIHVIDGGKLQSAVPSTATRG